MGGGGGGLDQVSVKLEPKLNNMYHYDCVPIYFGSLY